MLKFKILESCNELKKKLTNCDELKNAERCNEFKNNCENVKSRKRYNKFLKNGKSVMYYKNRKMG